ncbi:MAG TPA: hypothetical protein VIU83_00195, partial [Candidatus Deferrimicrobium sp.]
FEPAAGNGDHRVETFSEGTEVFEDALVRKRQVAGGDEGILRLRVVQTGIEASQGAAGENVFQYGQTVAVETLPPAAHQQDSMKAFPVYFQHPFKERLAGNLEECLVHSHAAALPAGEDHPCNIPSERFHLEALYQIRITLRNDVALDQASTRRSAKGSGWRRRMPDEDDLPGPG